jgi:hypothetical protein
MLEGLKVESSERREDEDNAEAQSARRFAEETAAAIQRADEFQNGKNTPTPRQFSERVRM